MAARGTYELGFNWPGKGADAFAAEVLRAARHRRVRVLCVGRGQAARVRRDVDRRRIRVGLFLNTQADGVNFDSPDMLLCRALKASGCHVVEDPDDAKNYADRSRVMQYLERAGLPVPPYCVVSRWSPERPLITPAQRRRLGATWVAQPAVGMSRNRVLVSRARTVRAALLKAGFRPGEKVLLLRHCAPASWGDRELRFRVWHLFGEILIGWPKKGSRVYEVMTVADLESGRFSELPVLVRRIAAITGLDWFLTELVATRWRRDSPEVFVVEPANALAGLGPGLRPLSALPPGLVRRAAERIVEVAWRRARGLPLVSGASVCTAP